MVSIAEFFKKADCEENLCRLLGEVIPAAVEKIRGAIQAQDGKSAGSKNVYGEAQLELDVQANEIILSELKKSGLVVSAASEELEDILTLNPAGVFNVAFDPLDGSSLVDVNFAIGSIFGIYPAADLIGKTGDDQLAACFAVYGPRTTIILTTKKGTHEFRLEQDGNFYLTKENLRVSEQAKHFAPGNLRAAAEREDYLKLVNDWIREGLTLRYSGGMVPDLNHILLKGDGIFVYPSYSKAPQGKLRLLFECNPIALLMEQAAGVASDGERRILSKKIAELHQRTPIYVGSKKEAEKAAMALQKSRFPH